MIVTLYANTSAFQSSFNNQITKLSPLTSSAFLRRGFPLRLILQRVMAQPSTHPRTTDVSRSSPSLTNTNTIAGTKRKRTSERKFYAVKEGRRPGIYNTWDECLAQIRGHKGATFKAFQSHHEAQAFVEGKILTETNIRSSTEQVFYAVQNGIIPGIYTDWGSVLTQIKGFKNPQYRKFHTRAEAESFVSLGKKVNGNIKSRPEEEKKRAMIQQSAPGLIVEGIYTPKDKEGNSYELGRGPLPPGAQDGYDPNIKLNHDGNIINKTEEEKSKTKSMNKDHEPPGMLRIYTDGSSLKNGQAGARAGVGVYFGPQDPNNVSEALKGSKQTNQRAELTAILRALDIAPIHREVTIYTDSQYAIRSVTEWSKVWERNGWVNSKNKPVENKDLVMEIREKIVERDLLKKGTYFVWVKGHANDEGNIAADRLAVEGATMGRGHREETTNLAQPNNGNLNGSYADEIEKSFRLLDEAKHG